MNDEKMTARPRGTDGAKVISVIVTESIAGRGTEDDPVRSVLQYWSFQGELLAVNDSWLNTTKKPRHEGT